MSEPTKKVSQQGAWRWAAVPVALLLGLALAGSVLQAAPAPPKPPKAPKAPKNADKWLNQHLPEAQADDRIPVIVKLKPGADDSAVEALKKKHQQDKKQDLDVVSSFSAELTPDAIRDLSEHSDVLGVSYDSPMAPSTVGGMSGKAKNTAYNLRTTLGVTGGVSGKNVTVAVIDSGIFPAPELGNRIVKFIDFTRGGIEVPPVDPYGHGTHVAGIIASGDPTAPGIAKDVKLIGLRVLDANGTGSTSTVIAAIQWATVNRAAYKIDVINLSLGHPIEEPAATDPLVQAVEAAVQSGIVVVVSAGNEGVDDVTRQIGYASILSPGNAPSAITVGAERTYNTNTRGDDDVADYSSRGPTWYDAFAKPDIVAPGHKMLSISDKTIYLYQQYPNLRGKAAGDREYLTLSGTSMSAAVVSGSVALMLETARAKFAGLATPGAPLPKGSTGATLTPNMIKAMLMNSAFKLGDPNGAEYDVFTQGAGGLNAGGAITLAQSLDPRVPAGGNWLASPFTETTAVDGQTISWANRIVWFDEVLLGDVLYANNAAWSGKTAWGQTSNGGFSGTSILDRDIVWANQNIWVNQMVGANAKQIVWGNAKQIVWGNAKQIVWGNSVFASSENSLDDVLVTK